MNATAYNTYKNLLDYGEASWSSIPVTMRNADSFLGLLSAKILNKERRGRGLKIIVAKKEAFAQYFRTHFPHDVPVDSKSGNIRKYRNSKIKRIDSQPVFLFRGFGQVQINAVSYTHLTLPTIYSV